MSWVNDLASALGLPAGAATLAVAMYAACSAAEKAARPEALKEIGRILKDPSWEHSVRPSVLIEQLFDWTFGEHHLSWKCVRRSLAATILFSICLVIIFHVVLGKYFEPVWSLSFPELYGGLGAVCAAGFLTALGLLLFGAFPDYVALIKTRFLVSLIVGARQQSTVVVLVIADIFLSALISFSFALGLYVALEWYPIHLGWGTSVLTRTVDRTLWDARALIDTIRMEVDPPRIMDAAMSILRTMAAPLVTQGGIFSMSPVILLSTLFTSVWTVLTLISITILKLVTPLHRFTAWFFDVETHPLQAVGIVAGGLMMMGSLVWSVVRAVT